MMMAAFFQIDFRLWPFGGHDPGVCALGQGAWGLWLVGKPDQSLAMAARAIVLGDSMTDGYSRATGH